jgi:hypothetical protein
MKVKNKGLQVLDELKNHAPFTLLGAVAGIAFMIIFRNTQKEHAEVMFGIFHPAHVFLSAMVTASVFAVHYHKKQFIKILLVGYFGSIGVATLSDSIVPYIGEKIFSLDIPTHSHSHGHEDEHIIDEHGHEAELHNENIIGEHSHDTEDVIVEHNIIEHENTEHETLHEEDGHHHSGAGLHLGFVEEWYIVHPVAILGIILAWFIPTSKCPHAAHVLISTWATSAHILMNSHVSFTPGVLGQIFGILFLAVWLPCCISDIVFPMLFADSDLAKSGLCACHQHKKENSNE